MSGYNYNYKSQGDLSKLLHLAGVTNLADHNGQDCTPEQIERKVYEDGGYRYPLFRMSESGEPEQIVLEKGDRLVVLTNAYHRGYFFVETEDDGIKQDYNSRDIGAILGIADPASYVAKSQRKRCSSRVTHLRS